MPKKIVIIGGGAAALTAAAFARKVDRGAEITIICDERYFTYSRCAIPYAIEGIIPRIEGIQLHDETFFQNFKINYMRETVATKIDATNKTVEITKGGRAEKLPYDSLVLAMGARAFMPPVPGTDKKGVFAVRTIDDGRKILEAAKAAKKAVVVGARFVGLETAVAMKEKGLDVVVVEMLPQILADIFDGDMAAVVQKKLEEKGIRFSLGKKLDAISGSDRVAGVAVGGENVPADIVVMGAGVKANLELAAQMGVALGQSGLIKTNEKMQTNVPDVYAAGDCVESVNLITKTPCRSQLGTTAVRMAKAAGTNAAGGSMEFSPVLNACVTKIFDMELAATGITTDIAKKAGINAVSVAMDAPIRPEYYPEEKKIRIKLIADKDTGTLIGAQAMGPEEAGLRINYCTLAIAHKIPVKEIAKGEFCYCPPVADVNEALSVAAEFLARRL